MDIVSARIKQRREALRLTQDELAERLGYKSRTSIAKLEGSASGLPQSKIVKIARALETTPGYLLGWDEVEKRSNPMRPIPIVGAVTAGKPIDRIEVIDGYESIPDSWSGDYFALRIKGDSMEPKISDGDIVIVRVQQDAEDGEIVIAAVNGDEATCKRLRKQNGTIMLQPNNPAYFPIVWDGRTGPAITIIGKVVELRCRF